jgi:hypothetical protein
MVSVDGAQAGGGAVTTEVNLTEAAATAAVAGSDAAGSDCAGSGSAGSAGSADSPAGTRRIWDPGGGRVGGGRMLPEVELGPCTATAPADEPACGGTLRVPRESDAYAEGRRGGCDAATASQPASAVQPRQSERVHTPLSTPRAASQ